MEKSIESIWKNGFSDHNLVAPKVFDLYNRKSINVVDKLLEMGKSNLLFIVGGGIVLLSIAINNGATIAGIVLFCLLMIAVMYGKKQSKKIKELDKTQSSYIYLKLVKQWLDETILGYTKLYRVLYPALILTFSIGFLTSDAFSEGLISIKQNSPDLLTFLGVPLIWYIPIIIVAIASSVFTSRLYKADLNIVYKGVFNKLDNLIADMEELAK